MLLVLLLHSCFATQFFSHSHALSLALRTSIEFHFVRAYLFVLERLNVVFWIVHASCTLIRFDWIFRMVSAAHFHTYRHTWAWPTVPLYIEMFSIYRIDFRGTFRSVFSLLRYAVCPKHCRDLCKCIKREPSDRAREREKKMLQVFFVRFSVFYASCTFLCYLLVESVALFKIVFAFEPCFWAFCPVHHAGISGRARDTGNRSTGFHLENGSNDHHFLLNFHKEI